MPAERILGIPVEGMPGTVYPDALEAIPNALTLLDVHEIMVPSVVVASDHCRLG
jgi:hypothetical protein